MKPVLTREQMRAFDQDAITDAHVPGLVLMENAGRGAAEVLVQMLAQRRADGIRGANVSIVCGAGNNGGDGFVVARRLFTLGASPTVFLCAPRPRLAGDALINAEAWEGLGGAIVEVGGDAGLRKLTRGIDDADLIVDALFGTGLDREITGLFARVIGRLNDARPPVVALDVPSGLDANTGAVLGVAVRAAVTVTFAHLKRGLLGTVAANHVGQVHVVDIGVPPGRAERLGACGSVVERADIGQWLQPRPIATHKAAAGRVVAFVGSPGTIGAALLVSRGALRAGAGLVTIATMPAAARIIEARVLEEMTARLDSADFDTSIDHLLAKATAVAIGPGLGTGDEARRIVKRVVMQHTGPVVIDADALTLLADRGEKLTAAAGPRLLTPHPGEMARLLATSPQEVEADRFSAVERACTLTGATVLLKGPHTIVQAPNSGPLVVSTHAPALATGGAGDVLTGVCAALACHLSLPQAAAAAAFIHGQAAERWMRDRGADRGLLASEVADLLPDELAALRPFTARNGAPDVVCPQR